MGDIRLALIALLAMAGSAEAACGTASLAGKWTLIGQSEVCAVTVQTSGNFSGTCSDSTSRSGTISQTSNCKITGSANGVSFKGRTETIRAASADVPVLIFGASSNGAIAFSGFRQ